MRHRNLIADILLLVLVFDRVGTLPDRVRQRAGDIGLYPLAEVDVEFHEVVLGEGPVELVGILRRGVAGLESQNE